MDSDTFQSPASTSPVGSTVRRDKTTTVIKILLSLFLFMIKRVIHQFHGFCWNFLEIAPALEKLLGFLAT